MTDLLTNPTLPSSTRSARDAYWTPPRLTQALLDAVPEVRGAVWEPCAGAGWMADVLAQRCRVFASDIDPQRDSIDALDFLAAEPRPHFDWIITNPPFILAADILRHALRFTPRVALLVRLTFLEGTGERLPLLERHTPDRVIILPRIKFPRDDGRPQRGTDSVPPCWLVWGVEPRPVSWGGHR